MPGAPRVAGLIVLLAGLVIFSNGLTLRAEAPAATQPTTQSVGKLPHIGVDVKGREIRVDCFAAAADYPLEFLLVRTNTNEYESIVRTDAKASDLHLALLMLGLTPGEPVHFSEAENKWYPPSGPVVDISFEYLKDGKVARVGAYQWMRDVTTKKPPGGFEWCFTGSRFLDNGEYGADATGQLISVVNNDFAVLDVPAMKSRAMDSREWERNSEAMPAANTPVTMIITPVAGKEGAGTQPAAGVPGK